MSDRCFSIQDIGRHSPRLESAPAVSGIRPPGESPQQRTSKLGVILVPSRHAFGGIYSEVVANTPQRKAVQLSLRNSSITFTASSLEKLPWIQPPLTWT